MLTGPMLFVALRPGNGRQHRAGRTRLRTRLRPASNSSPRRRSGLLLFTDATRIDVGSTPAPTWHYRPACSSIGLPLAIAIGTATRRPCSSTSPSPMAALLAAILAPTDAALGEAVVTSDEVPVRIRQSLNVESGLNDGIALPAVTVFVALAAEDEAFSTASSWIRFAAEQIGYGDGHRCWSWAVVGAVADPGGEPPQGRWRGVYRQLAVLGARHAHGVRPGGTRSGATASSRRSSAGLAFSSIARVECATVANFTDDLAHLLAMVSFIVFGAIVVGPSLDELDWRVATLRDRESGAGATDSPSPCHCWALGCAGPPSCSSAGSAREGSRRSSSASLPSKRRTAPTSTWCSSSCRGRC